MFESRKKLLSTVLNYQEWNIVLSNSITKLQREKRDLESGRDAAIKRNFAMSKKILDARNELRQMKADRDALKKQLRNQHGGDLLLNAVKAIAATDADLKKPKEEHRRLVELFRSRQTAGQAAAGQAAAGQAAAGQASAGLIKGFGL
jgi:hypothetical protein